MVRVVSVYGIIRIIRVIRVKKHEECSSFLWTVRLLIGLGY